MEIKALKNTFEKRGSSRTITLFSGCSCCCCSILTPIGGFVAEIMMNNTYPKRGHLWRHILVNTIISLISLIVAWYLTVSSNQQGIFIAVAIVIGYILFYLYSFTWLDDKKPTSERLKAVALETLLTGIFVALFTYLSFALYT